MTITKNKEYYEGEDVSVFLTNNDGGSVESTASFKFNSINNQFNIIDVDNSENKYSYNDEDIQSQLIEAVTDYEKTRKNTWEDDPLKQLYDDALQNIMDQDSRTKNLSDFDVDYIISNILENENMDKLGDYDYSTDFGSVITIDRDYYDKIITKEIENLNYESTVHNNINENGDATVEGLLIAKTLINKHKNPYPIQNNLMKTLEVDMEIFSEYSDKQFILIQNNNIEHTKDNFVKGLDMSYRNNDIYVYNDDTDMSHIVERMNSDLKVFNSTMTAKIVSFEDMKNQHSDIITSYHLRKKAKQQKQENELTDKFSDKIFLFISNNDKNSKDFIQGDNMKYSNDDLYVYNKKEGLEFIVDGINKELKSNKSSMVAKLHDFETMCKLNKNVLIEKLNKEKTVISNKNEKIIKKTQVKNK